MLKFLLIFVLVSFVYAHDDTQMANSATPEDEGQSIIDELSQDPESFATSLAEYIKRNEYLLNIKEKRYKNLKITPDSDLGRDVYSSVDRIGRILKFLREYAKDNEIIF